jgi:hypothetical protein
MFSLFKYIDVNLNKDIASTNEHARQVWFTIPLNIEDDGVDADGQVKYKYSYMSFPCNAVVGEDDSILVYYYYLPYNKVA